MDTISRQAKAELLAALRERYVRGTKQKTTRILDEFAVVAGGHRKHAIRLLARMPPTASQAPAVNRRIYDEAVRESLVVLWEAADRICGKRLKSILPSLVTALEHHGHLALDAAVRQRLLAVSAAIIDRLLASVRGQASHRKKRRTPTKPSKQVPIRTFSDWTDSKPGCLEIDFVAHGGSSIQGNFLWSLVATDVFSGWTEAVPLCPPEN